MTKPVVIGVSACLLGEHVRYDGGHKHDHYITDTLGVYFRFAPVCPEVGCGLPVPRETMRLEGDPAAPRLMTRQSRVDRTDQMLVYCATKIRELEGLDLCGFIFKGRSPSCGLAEVPLYCGDMADMFTIGLFAQEVARCFPLLPLVEAERLANPQIRNNFLERVYSCRRMQDVHKGLRQ